MTLRVGHVWVLAKNPALEVHSPLVSVTAASGSFYRFSVVLSSATSVSVERGTAWVKQKVGGKELIVVGEGKSLRVEPRGSSDLSDIKDAGRPRWLSFFDSF
jgi:ferric-dicitrate binding protein FerR (iron transport regulator)